MKKLEYQVVFQALTQLPTSFVINKSTLQENQKWCKIVLSLAHSTNNLIPCAMKSIIKNVINLMVSSSTSKFTKKNSYNYKAMWRKIISKSGGIAIASYNQTKENKPKKKGEFEWGIVLLASAISRVIE